MMLNRTDRGVHPCLVPDLEGKCSTFLSLIMVFVVECFGFLVLGFDRCFYQVDEVPSIPSVLKGLFVLIMNGC